MNKRLEQEYARYIAEHKGGAPGDTVTLNVKDVAEHFYNLALEDVKKEIESKLDVPNRKVKWREKHELEPDYNVRVCVLLKDILDFIEKQEV